MEQKPFCFTCGGVAGLEVELLYPYEDLIARFDRELRSGFPSFEPAFRELRLQEQWRTFFRMHEKFRTRCKRCIHAEVRAKGRTAATEISDDDEADELPQGRGPPQIHQLHAHSSGIDNVGK